MNVLVIGRGGREHSIVMKLAESKQVKKIFVAPGNAGMESLATLIPIQETDMEKLIVFVKKESIDLTIVGPENPLLEGIANQFELEGLRIFAPSKEAALIEGSKSFAKDFMVNYGIPTANYEIFTDAVAAKRYIERSKMPIVIKADGLAAGKGVVVAHTKDIAFKTIDDMLIDKKFSEAGAKVVMEEFLSGDEFSLMAFVNGEKVYPMVPARDHKRAFDNDEGPNTGGMGAFAPVPDITNETIDYATKEILQKAATGLVAEGRSFTGVLYAGLIMTENGPKVIEFNARFGDPETQVVLPLLVNDLSQVLLDVLDGVDPLLEWEQQSCLGVVLAAQGYPSAYTSGAELPNLNGDFFIAYAGVERHQDKLVSNGGRVLVIGSKGPTLEDASHTVYASLPPNEVLDGLFYRTDIGRQKQGALK